jgi:succinoglycan biosynthesis protein ExoM
MARVTIMIPTQRRLGGLAVAARSVLAQSRVDHSELELVIVDNDQVPSAKDVARDLAAEAPFPVHYVHEPRAGVANARNAGMARASGQFVAFLDDDEEAPAGWLAALLAAQEAYAADVVFGPVRARAPDSVTSHRDYLERFFSRIGPEQAGVIDHYYGCGDSLLKRSSLPDPVAPFAAERNHIGGEDDMLFGHMRAGGAVFAWEPAAWVWEDPVPDRLTLDYTIRRAFAYGQGPSAHCAAAVPPDRVGVARWMAVGVVQAALFGAVAGFKWLTRAGDRAEWLDRAARGLGKTLWWGPFKIHFYGHSA